MAGKRQPLTPEHSPPGAVRIGGRFTRGTQILLGLFASTCALWHLPTPVAGFMANYLILRPAEALGPMPWQLVTGPLIQTHPLQLLFTGFLLYSVGSGVEQLLGLRRFLRLCAGASLLSALAAALLGRLWPGHGMDPVLFEATPVFMALLGAFAVLLGDQRATLFGMGQPLSVKAISGFFIGLSLLMYVLNRQILEAGAAVVATLYGLRVGPRPLGPSDLIDYVSRLFHRYRARRADAQRRRFTVLSGGLPPRPRDETENSKDRRWVN